MKRKELIFILISPFLLTSCFSEITKAYKAENSCRGVYNKGIEYYNAGNYQKAMEFFNNAPECQKKHNDSSSYSSSMLKLAEMHYFGIGVKQNYAKALDYAKASGKKLFFDSNAFNSLPSFFNTYWNHLAQFNNILLDAEMEIKEQAKAGNAQAQYQLSALHFAKMECPFQQENCKDNAEQAMFWLEKAAQEDFANSKDLLYFIRNVNNKEPEAQYNIAMIYKKNNSIAEYEKAIETAALSDYEPAKPLYDEILAARKAEAERLAREAAEKERIEQEEKDRQRKAELYEKLHQADTLFAKGEYLNAFEAYKSLAEEGLPEAQNKTAYFYYTALKNVVKGDKALALEWYRKAAVQGHVPSMYELGLMYEFGKGTKASDATAFSWYKKAAEGGDSNAIFKVGISYKYGDGTSKNPAKALEYLKLAAQEKTLYLPAMQELVNLCYVEKDFAQARSYQSQKESAEAMGSIADQETLVRWYKKLADRGNKAAAFMIEFQDITGNDREQRERREKCLETAWKNGLLWPSYLYAKEIINSHDRSIKAAEETAADLANGPFQKTESEIKRQTREAVENAENEYREKMKKAVQMLTKNAEYGDPVAQRELAQVYREYSPLKNNAKAFTWYKKAAENNDETAIRSLAVMYEKGIGTTKNAEAAANWYDKIGEYEKAESLR